MLKKSLCTSALLLGLSPFVNATIVEFQTSHGSFQVNLFDQSTPKTVANFLQYIDEQHYTNSVIHRVVPDFVVQGGGFTFKSDWPLTRITTNSAIINEPIYSNVKGTIAMAKLGDNPNSATDQWFFNLKDNSSNLDQQNGGFTVFGQVIDDGMDIVEAIANQSLCQDIPMTNYSNGDCNSLATPGIENFVSINQIVIVDSSEVTDANLTPVKNTLSTASEDSNSEGSNSNSSSGGAFMWMSLFCLLPLTLRKLLFK